jgi:hypothetical protein
MFISLQLSDSRDCTGEESIKKNPSGGSRFQRGDAATTPPCVSKKLNTERLKISGRWKYTECPVSGTDSSLAGN